MQHLEIQERPSAVVVTISIGASWTQRARNRCFSALHGYTNQLGLSERSEHRLGEALLILVHITDIGGGIDIHNEPRPGKVTTRLELFFATRRLVPGSKTTRPSHVVIAYT